jgi:ATP-binding cassette, subfamily B, bacterial PglK
MAVFEVLSVASIAPFMGVVTNPKIIHQNEYLHASYVFFEFNSDTQFIVILGFIVIGLIVFGNAYTAFINWKFLNFSYRQGHYLSTRLLSSYLSQPYSYFLSRNSSNFGKNILHEVSRSISSLIVPALNSLSRVLVILMLVLMLFFVNTLTTLIALAILGGSYLIIFTALRRRLHQIGKLSSKSVLEHFKFTNEAFSGIKYIKLRGNENSFVDRFKISSKNNADYSIESASISILPRYFLEALVFGGIISILLYNILKGEQGNDIIPILSLYAFAGYRLMPALQQVYGGMTAVKYNMPALQLIIKDLKECESKITNNINQIETIPFEKSLKLKSLNFHYENTNKNILNNINLKIQCRTTVGIVGSTGSGKTTLVDIILGLLTQNSGNIFIDDLEINLDNKAGWQQLLGYVPQSIFLTDDTIERNIAFSLSDDEINPSKVKKASKIAELDSFIHELPSKYKTYVGERGVRLSGGQRQRIGIARALYHDPKVLVFDEATSALDGITENAIVDAIHNLSKEKTIIMIAHRISTVKECDIIYVLNNGSIIDSGTYDELITSSEYFRNIDNSSS